MTISDNELAWMRAAVKSDLFPSTCNLSTLTHTVDDLGGWIDAIDTVSYSVVCSVQTMSPTQQGQQIAARFGDEPLWEIWVAHDQSLTADMRVTYLGETYEIVWVDDNTSDILYRRGLMRKVPGKSGYVLLEDGEHMSTEDLYRLVWEG